MGNNPLKRLAGDTLVYGMGTIIPRLLNYLLVPVYTYWVFTPQQYGKVTELYAFVAILLVLLTYGMEISFFRYANQYKKDVKKVFSTATTSLLITSTIFFVVVFFNKLGIARLIRYSGHPEFIVMIALIVGLDAISTIPFAYLRFRNKARRFSTIKIINVIINIGFNITLLIIIPRSYPNTYQHFWLYRITPLVGMVFLSNVLASFSTILLLLPEMRNFRPSIDKILLKKMLGYGLPILVIGLAGMINEVSDKILLRYFLPHSVNAERIIGIYGANYKLAILMMLFIQMFRYAAEPFFFAEYEKSDAKKTYSRVMTAFVGFSWFIFLMVMLFIDGFKYFIGPAFWDGLQIVPIVLMAKLFLGVFYNLSVWYKLTDKTIYGGIIAVFGASVTIVLNIILIPKYGYVGSAWANFFCYFSMMVFSYLWGRKIFQVLYEVKKIGLFTAIALLFYFVSTKLPGQIKEHFIAGGAMLLIYSVVVLLAVRKDIFPKKVNGTSSL